MKKSLKITLMALAAILAISHLSGAQTASCNFKKAYKVSDRTTLSISNKYGDINIINTEADSLIICATIAIEPKDEKTVMENLKFIKVSFSKKRDTVMAITTFDNKFFSRKLANQRKKFSVDYLIKAPSFMNLRVTNSFGNVVLDDVAGVIDISLYQGLLSAKNLLRGNEKPINSISIINGRANIDVLNWASFELKKSPSVSIGKATAILIVSDYSKVAIGEINSLITDSKSDSYKIGLVRNLQAESLYSSFEVGVLSGIMKSGTSFGSISILGLTREFSSIGIASDNSIITILNDDNVSFNADIIAENATVEIPSSQLLKRSVSGKTTTITGIAGADKNTGSLLKIRATAGKVSIR